MATASDTSDPKRARILDAARAVCARSGSDGARMDEIAAEAQVSKGTLYRFFASKEDLLLEGLIESHLSESYAGFADEDPAALAPARRLEELLERMARVMPEATRRMPVNMQVWGLVAEDASEARARLVAALADRIYPLRSEQLVDAVVAGVQAGVWRREIDPEAFAAAVLAVFDGTLYRSVFDPGHANPDALRASFRALVAGIRAPAGADRG